MVATATAAIGISLLLYLLAARRTRRLTGAIAYGAMLLGAVILLATLTFRGLIAGHWPLGSQYEFTLGFALIVASIYLVAERGFGERRAGVGVSLIVLILLARALTMPLQAKALGPLPPVLRSFWLQAHVLTVMLGYGCFGVAAGAGLMALGAGAAQSALRSMARHLVEIGFPWLTLGILTGAMWAHNAWGRSWGWDPKETWSLITWLWYLAILHLTPARREDRYLSWLVLIGFGLVLFTFIGVPALARSLSLDTLHGY